MIGIQDASGLSGISRVAIQDAAGSADIARISMRDAGGDFVLFDSATAGTLDVAISPSPVVGSDGQSGDAIIETGPATAVASGGTEPYSYAWDDPLGSSDWAIETPLSATTSFTALSVSAGASATNDFRCTVTDARGRTGTATVQARAFNYGGLF